MAKRSSENLKKVYEEIEGKLKKYKKSSVQKDEKVYCEITFFVGYQTHKGKATIKDN
jgi:hypothetical protein